MPRPLPTVPESSAAEVPAHPVVAADGRDAEVVRCRQVAFSAALQLVGNRDEALDLAQETMLRVMRSIDTLDPDRSWRPYVLRVVTNLARDLWRRRRRRRTESLDTLLVEHGFDAADHAAGPERRAVEQEERRRVTRALAALDTPHREILVLRDFQDLPYAEIAAVLRVPVGTVMSRLHRARLALREALGGGARRM
jgi:RNA polymerase sigma-70 factor, ECF subfamily